MRRSWLLHRIRDEVLLDLINYPNMTIDEILDKYNTSKAKLYEYFRGTYGTTPGKWRKEYFRGCHWAARFYFNGFKVALDDEFDDERITDDHYIDPVLNDQDAPLTYSLTHVKTKIDGTTHFFKTKHRLRLNEWENIHSTNRKYTVSIRLTRGGRNPTVQAMLSLGGHVSGKISMPYDLELTVVSELVGYDNDSLKDRPRELLVPTEGVMEEIGPDDEYDLSLRTVYLMKVGRQTLMLGLYEALDPEDVNRLHPNWKRTPLNNALRRKLRTAFHTGEYVDITMKKAIEMQARVTAIMDQIGGVPVCSFKKDHKKYLVALDEESDLTDLPDVCRYLDAAPTRLERSSIRDVARRSDRTVLSLSDVVQRLRT